MGRDTPGGSDEGGFDELVEFWFRRAFSSSTSDSSEEILKSAARRSVSSSAMRWSRGSAVTPRVDHTRRECANPTGVHPLRELIQAGVIPSEADYLRYETTKRLVTKLR